MEIKDKEKLRELFDQFCREANIDQRKEKLDYLFNWFVEVSYKAGYDQGNDITVLEYLGVIE